MQHKQFVEKVWAYYRAHGRELPWRETLDPYAILVSEVMLQQTQASRVVPKYEAWMERFSDFQALARASLGAVLVQWQGLGYNRRGRYLWELAKIVIRDYQGILPREETLLRKLPGIGEYTARAIRAFAFNEPGVVLETNIRSVFIAEFFAGKVAVDDREIIPLIEATLDPFQPREWYYALMDYGAHLKTVLGNPSRISRHYTKQTPFKGSFREVRGAIIRELTLKPKLHFVQLLAGGGFERARVEQALADLVREGMVIEEDHCYRLPH